MYRYALEETAGPESEVAYPEYYPHTGTLICSFDDTYLVSKGVQDYLKTVEGLLETTPLRKIYVQPLDIEILPPEEEDSYGLIRITGETAQ